MCISNPKGHKLLLFLAFGLLFIIASVIFRSNGYKIQQVAESEPIFYDDLDIKTFLWPKDDQCSKFSTRFSKHLKATYLVSFPRSGNTWLRYLLEAATGVFTSSVYSDERFIQMGFYGEADNIDSGRTIVIKTHGQSGWRESKWSVEKRLNHIPMQSSVILLLRNPLISIPSFWSLYLALQTKLKHDKSSLFYLADEETFHSQEFHNFVSKRIAGWRQLVEDRLIWTANLHIVFYEDLLNDPLLEVEKILNFLEFPVNQKRLNCIRRNLQGPAKKSHTTVNKIPFTLYEKKEVAYALASVASLVQRRNVQLPNVYSEMIKNYTAMDF